jgi:hypothetical protein
MMVLVLILVLLLQYARILIVLEQVSLINQQLMVLIGFKELQLHHSKQDLKQGT